MLEKIKQRMKAKKLKKILNKKEPEPLPKPEPPEEEAPPEEPKPVSMADKIDKINEQLELITKKKKIETKFKKKRFKIPYKVRSQLKKGILKNKVQVMLIQRNSTIKGTVGEIKNGMLVLGKDLIHDCPMDCIGLWNGKIPTVILPEWDLKPLSLSSMYRDAIDNKRLADPQRIIIRTMAMKEALQGRTLQGKQILWIIIISAIVFGVLFMGGK